MVDTERNGEAIAAQEQEGKQEKGDTDGLVNEPVAILDPMSAAAEAYRTLRTNLFYAVVDNPPKVIVMTSPGRGEGKSTTCTNLGAVLAQAGKNTLVMDCDLRRPKIHTIFGLRNFQGMVDVLATGGDPRDIWWEPLPSLKVLTVGSLPPNPAELLESKRFAEFVGQMRQEFDYVLIDAPPVEAVSDPLILAKQADGVLLVVDAQSTRKAALRRSMNGLAAVDANVLGAVMNNVDTSGTSYGRYQSYAY